MATILILTYHEITQDPRVLKQAKALQSDGNNVFVYCEWLDGFDKCGQVDGLNITRFKCFNHDCIPLDGFKKFTLFKKTYIKASPFIKKYIKWLKYYQNICIDSNRHRSLVELKKDRFYFLKSLFFKISIQFRNIINSFLGFYIRKRMKNSFRELYQLSSFVYALNLERGLKISPDIVHSHDIYTLPAAVLISMQNNSKVVYDAHEYEIARSSKMPKHGNAIVDALERDCLKHVDRMTTVSPGIGKLYHERFHGPPPKIIYNSPAHAAGCDLDQYFSNHQSLRSMMALDDSTPLIVYLGLTLKENRGVDKLIEALGLLPGCFLAILGPRHTKNDQWVIGHAQKLNVNTRVKLLPPVPHEFVTSVIKSANVSVCPIQDVSLSYRYCLPNKFFEAAFAHVPICVSDLPEMKSIVDELQIGETFNQSDPCSIAEKIFKVINNPEDYRYTPRVKELLDRKYSWESQRIKIISLFRELSN